MSIPTKDEARTARLASAKLSPWERARKLFPDGCPAQPDRPRAARDYAQAALALSRCAEHLGICGEDFSATAAKCRQAVERILAEEAAPSEAVPDGE